MSEMKSLERLDVSSNDLSGLLPKTVLSSCYSLKLLALSNNQFQGQIFPEHANLTALVWLLLDGNSFNGSLGKGLLNTKDLRLLDISNNSISGTVPLWIGRMSNLLYLDISDNSFSGSIPRNVDFQSLKVLNLQNNEFTGTTPDTLFESEKLQQLYLSNNNFSGMILNTNGKTSHLVVLAMRNNSFQSHIPEEICQLSKVGILDLSRNKFTGSIPSCFGNMPFDGRIYDDGYILHPVHTAFMQHCSYRSSITDLDDDLQEPNESGLTTITGFYKKGTRKSYLDGFYGMDFSSNELSGEIPLEIGNMTDIIYLNFSHNRLTGSIPVCISKLKDLESLDLSNNKLHGKIPSQLTELNSLVLFNVSRNNFSGEIPFKGQLITFDERSYIGNDHLCGPPTNKSCYLEPSAPKQGKEEEDKGDDVIDMEWFYWTCAAVYISTCLALFAFLCIDSRWSREWFYRVDLYVHHLQRLKGRFICN